MKYTIKTHKIDTHKNIDKLEFTKKNININIMWVQ